MPPVAAVRQPGYLKSPGGREIRRALPGLSLLPKFGNIIIDITA